jgi:hypothetical protein
MKKVKYLLVPVLVTLIILVVSLYPSTHVTRKASAAPRAAVVTKYLMIPAAAFNPRRDGHDFYNNGYSVGLDTGVGDFGAPVFLPPGARLRSITLFAFDGNTNADLCAWFFVAYPKTGTNKKMKTLCTTGSSGDQQHIRYFSNYYVKWYYGYYIWLKSG